MDRKNLPHAGGMGVTPPKASKQEPFATYDAKYGADTSSDTSMKTSADTSADTSVDMSADFSADFAATFSVMNDDPQWPSVAPKI